MRAIGALGSGEVPTAQETTDCAQALNLMVKQWQGKADFAPGLKMWSRKRGFLFLSTLAVSYSLGPSGDHWTSSFVSTTLTAAAATSATSLTVASISGISNGDNIGIILTSGAIFWTTVSGSPSGVTVTIASGLTGPAASGNTIYTYTSKTRRPLQLVTAVIRDSNSNDIPLNYMTVEDYQALPSKANSTATGDPSAIYYESQLTNGVLYVDVYPSDLTKYLHFVYLSPIEDFNAATDTPDYPQQWYNALKWGLAKQIAPEFGLQFTDDMESNYTEAVALARDQDPESTSDHFRPDDN